MLNIYKGDGPDTSQDHLVGLTINRESVRPVVSPPAPSYGGKWWVITLVVAGVGLLAVCQLPTSTIVSVFKYIF